MTKFYKNGSSFVPVREGQMDVRDSLPVGTYMIKQNPQNEELYFDITTDFSALPKYYGNTEKMADRILQTFNDRPNSTGCLFVGEKGSGKSVQAKLICAKALDAGMPVIIITKPWLGEDLNRLMSSIKQPIVVFIDEFEKLYNRKEQESFLTLLDGVVQGQKLYLLTANDQWSLDQHMINRPGRIYYMMEYEGLDMSFIQEYCEDNLKNKAWEKEIFQLPTAFKSFNFDMLKAVVEETNRYDESPISLMEIMNIKVTTMFGDNHTNAEYFNMDLKIKGKEPKMEETICHINPLGKNGFNVFFDLPVDDGNTCGEIRFSPHDIVSADVMNGEYVFRIDDSTYGSIQLTLKAVNAKKKSISKGVFFDGGHLAHL